MSREINLKESDFELPADNAQAVMAWEKIQIAKRTIKALEEYAEERIMAFMKDKGINEIAITDTAKLILTIDKKDRFDTQAIYTALEFTPEQIEVLPANPSFRKKAILANGKTAPAHYIEESEALEPNGAAKKVLKEFDTRYLR